MPDRPWRIRLSDAWYRGAWWLWLLQPLALLFHCVVALRRGLYRAGLLRQQAFATPVVVVGNITVGGSGKTPVVIALVEALVGRGLRVGVVSRGYGADPGLFPREVTSASSAVEVGDEALLIHRRTHCPVVVDPDRPRAVRTLLSQYPVDIVLSDDGLQHYSLARTMEIVLYDAQRGFGNGHCLPAGPLREPLSRLSQADFVLARGARESASGVVLSTGTPVNVRSGEVRQLQALPGYPRAWVMVAIANPASFLHMLKEQGVDLRPRIYADHHRYNASDFEGLEHELVLMTEKDAVKCGSLVGDNAWLIPLTAQLPEHVVDTVAALAAPATS